MLSPITPAPITTVFGKVDEAVTEEVMTDSLRRARPARFSGFNLSRCRRAVLARAGRHPSLLSISARGLAEGKDFFEPPELRRAPQQNCP